MRRRQLGGEQGGAAEEAGVAEGGEHAHGQQPLVVRRQGAAEVAQGVGAHQPEQRLASRQAAEQRAQQRGADHHAHGIGADQQAGVGEADLEVGGDFGQEAHDDEFAAADDEAAKGQRQQGQGEEGARVHAGSGGGVYCGGRGFYAHFLARGLRVGRRWG
ncbi:hypothetical protein D9M71_350830 [compost metagenome]